MIDESEDESTVSLLLLWMEGIVYDSCPFSSSIDAITDITHFLTLLTALLTGHK